jgi:RNA polymerase sigma-70 factor (ECF subfamily)
MVRTDDAEIYRKHAGELIRFATALAGPSGAEDVLATAVVRAMESPRWPGIDNKRAYLFRAVLNESLRDRRSTERRLRREVRVAQTERVDASPADADVLAAISKLSVRQRAVVFLTYWSDLEIGSVAELLGVSARTVERELTNARRHLERILT